MKKILIIILLGILAPTLAARAFSLSPLRYIFTLERGDSVAVKITLNNYDPEAIILEPAIVGIKSDSQGRPVFDDALEQISWVKPDWNFVNLKEGAQAEVNFTITVPAGTYPGDYYVGVGAKRAAGNSAAVSIGEQLLALVNIKVAGEAREDLVVEKFEVAGKIFDKNKKFNLEIKNNGNVEVPVGAVLKITDWRGRMVFEDEVKLGDKILPLASRVASANFVIASVAKQSVWPGQYQAELAVNYGLTKQKITAVENFWYVPVWVMAAGGVVIFFIILLLSMRLRQRSRLSSG